MQSVRPSADVLVYGQPFCELSWSSVVPISRSGGWLHCSPGRQLGLEPKACVYVSPFTCFTYFEIQFLKMRCLMKTRILLATLTLALLTISAAAVLLVGPAGVMASSHREAPITALDPMADITDLWAFRSYDINGNDTNPPNITMIMASIPSRSLLMGRIGFPSILRFSIQSTSITLIRGRAISSFNFVSRPTTNCLRSIRDWRASIPVPAAPRRGSHRRLLISRIRA